MRTALGQVGRKFRRRRRGHDLFRVDVEMARVDGQLVADGETGRLPGPRGLFQVDGALRRALRRDGRFRGHAGNEADAILLARYRLRIRNPCAHGFPGGHGIRIHHQRLGDPQPPRRDAVGAGGAGPFQRFTVMRMQAFEGSFGKRFHRRRATRGDIRVQPDQVRHRAAEVALLAVDGHALDAAGLIPGREFFLPQIRNLLAQLGQHARFGEPEIQADATHALAFVLQRVTLFIRQARLRQRLCDGLFGLGEMTRVDLGDDGRRRRRRQFAGDAGRNQSHQE